jgi:hypothetical protein
MHPEDRISKNQGMRTVYTAIGKMGSNPLLKRFKGGASNAEVRPASFGLHFPGSAPVHEPL